MHRAIVMGVIMSVTAMHAAPGATVQAFVMDGDYIVTDAEELDHSSRWKRKTTYSGYTGSGYLRWEGPNQQCRALNSPEDDNHNDITGGCQGDPADWLRIPVYITRSGTYTVDLRNIHDGYDLGNDVWIHRVDLPPPIIRAYDHNVKSFNWLTSGPQFRSWGILEPGLYVFYVAGRSVGFGIDRVTVMRKTGPNNWPAAARDPSTPSMSMQSVDTATTDVARSRNGPRGVGGQATARRMYDLRGRPLPATGTKARGCALSPTLSRGQSGVLMMLVP
ncbi:MAG: hypothetical protein GF331_07275 [Chitinivibrionales bacterium]|nr:hypothetical protein [Chitinivibrionales bacterium]